MKTYDPDFPPISIHIPKCAGRSLETVLETWFGSGLLKHYPNKKRGKLLENTNCQDVSSKGTFAGISVFMVISIILGEMASLITIQKFLSS
jgi:hypothetical protein